MGDAFFQIYGCLYTGRRCLMRVDMVAWAMTASRLRRQQDFLSVALPLVKLVPPFWNKLLLLRTPALDRCYLNVL
ncbi:MAG: hypothetical protein II878_01560 [Bacteroidales bacterium]|nr:hypothetical protein [Bacteroidales bacterium]